MTTPSKHTIQISPIETQWIKKQIPQGVYDPKTEEFSFYASHVAPLYMITLNVEQLYKLIYDVSKQIEFFTTHHHKTYSYMFQNNILMIDNWTFIITSPLLSIPTTPSTPSPQDNITSSLFYSIGDIVETLLKKISTPIPFEPTLRDFIYHAKHADPAQRRLCILR